MRYLILILIVLFVGCGTVEFTEVGGSVTIGLKPIKEAGELVHVYILDLDEDKSYTPNQGMNFKESVLVCPVPVNGCIVSVLDSEHNIRTIDTIIDPMSYYEFTVDSLGNESQRWVYEL